MRAKWHPTGTWCSADVSRGRPAGGTLGASLRSAHSDYLLETTRPATRVGRGPRAPLLSSLRLCMSRAVATALSQPRNDSKMSVDTAFWQVNATATILFPEERGDESTIRQAQEH